MSPKTRTTCAAMALLLLQGVSWAHAAEPPALAADNAELAELYRADQADRAGGRLDQKGVARDATRRARLTELLAAGQVKTAQDHFHAAMVFQHGTQPADYERARDLARRAAELDPTLKQAKWLSAAAQDRYLQSVGKPQIYGTQYRCTSASNACSLEPFDRTAVTDEERQALGVPPLAEILKRLEEMNREQERMKKEE
jgi:uncharacterized protein DUF6624